MPAAMNPSSLLRLAAMAKRVWGPSGSRKIPSRHYQYALALVDFALTVSSLAVSLGLVVGIGALADLGVFDSQKLQLFLSFCCPLINMLQFIAPIPIVMECLRKLDAQTLPTPVFMSQSACNILGTAYGIRTQNKVILINNLFGLGCQTVYLGSNHFIRAGNGQWMWHTFKLQAVFCVALYMGVMAVTLEMLGQIITLFNLVLFAVPLASLGNILKTKNATALPAAMTVVTTVANGVWSLYGLLIQDMVVLLPSILGFELCVFQVLVLLWCYNRLPFDLGYLLLPCRGSSSPTSKVLPVIEEHGTAEDWPNPEVTPHVPSMSPRVLGNELEFEDI